MLRVFAEFPHLPLPHCWGRSKQFGMVAGRLSQISLKARAANLERVFISQDILLLHLLDLWVSKQKSEN